MTPVGDIADVCMGVTLRGRDATRPVPDGPFRMIRISDISNEGRLINPDLLRFEPGESIKQDLILRQGDVLFPNRGIRTTAYVFDLPEPNVIVGAQFYLIRPDQNVALPEYVAWYLRSEAASQHFHLRRKGTLVQTLQRTDIQELALPLPPLAKQRTIVALDALGTAERDLSLRLAKLRATYLEHQLLKSSAQH
ncbi:MAG: restriction endonuclease subunit S [Verrucomicrobiales bacterium]|nr:restriction endonuclease subunit S [Verrucomicrobiales bacterium]